MLDAATGRFQGPPPPTNGVEAAFAPLVEQLLPALSLTATIDSLVPHSAADYACGPNENGLGTCYTAWLTFDRDGVKDTVGLDYYHSVWASFGEPRFNGPYDITCPPHKSLRLIAAGG
jgi:hypothetical protein